MMRKCILAASVISIGLLGACSQTEKTEDTKATAVAKEETETVVSKEWKDLTVANDIIEGPQSAKEFISMYDESFNANVEIAFNQRTEDVLSTIEYYYYEESISLDNSLLDLPIVVEGESIEKDFKNMESLSYIIKGEQAKVLDGVTLPKSHPSEYDEQKYWNPPTKRMKQAIKYMKGLLNDLDIAISEGKGELTGYSYQAGGKKTDELEEFIKGSNQDRIDAREAAITPELKKVVKENFEYFDKLLNSDYFYKSRNADENDPIFDEGKEDVWITEEIKSEVKKRADEIEALIPTKSSTLDRDLGNVVGEMRTGFEYENGGDIYMPHRILYGLHAGMNGYRYVERDENGRKRLDPEGNWTETFTDEEVGY
ncbi:hypothetical protein SOP94_19040 [Peribacillus frigoritolerans]|uniref:hypothetical protein n=1 Tax=Peribacillus frigoritolerans TaxID=450367 RepID=UPI002B24E2D0|nr:hypothetical protein [Peribacillus frigoritolerans]MEB2630555.1 hypothetical protein [Peribacillus frigoritolerans]